jgi:dihydroxyacid dehydratase/phosphogluconate dehydratase
MAADLALRRHRGPAVVFNDYTDLEARIDNPNLLIAPQSVLVLKQAGPVGGPGMPEWGMRPSKATVPSERGTRASRARHPRKPTPRRLSQRAGL